MSGPCRIVFDTNVIVSALVFKSPGCYWIRSLWMPARGKRRVIPLASKDTTTELLRALHYKKFKLDEAAIEELIGDYLPFVEAVHAVEVRTKLPACRDPSDVKFLALAYAAKADALVTGDADLLNIAAESRIPMVAPGALQDWLASRD